jgi:hypothetical protein
VHFAAVLVSVIATLGGRHHPLEPAPASHGSRSAQVVNAREEPGARSPSHGHPRHPHTQSREGVWSLRTKAPAERRVGTPDALRPPILCDRVCGLVLLPGRLAAQGELLRRPFNYTGGDCLETFETRWWFIGKTSTDRLVKGEEIVRTTPELEKSHRRQSCLLPKTMSSMPKARFQEFET